MLRLLSQHGLVTWINQAIGPDILPQFRAYAHAMSVFPETLDYRWTLIADLDEFFCLDGKKFTSVRDFVLWHDHARADAIAIPWLIYVARTTDCWTNSPSIERFLQREESVNHHMKSLFRTALFWNANCHYPNAILRQDFAFMAETGQRHIAKSPQNSPALSQNPSATHAFVAHYIHRSAPEALAKVMRGRGDGTRNPESLAVEQMIETFVALSQRRKLVSDSRPLATEKQR